MKKEKKNRYVFPWMGINHKDEVRIEKTSSEYKTVPCEAYTIPELVKKSMSGIAPDIQYYEIYDPPDVDHDDIDYSKLSNADIVEKHEAAIKAAEVLQKVKDGTNTSRKGKQSMEEENNVKEEKIVKEDSLDSTKSE